MNNSLQEVNKKLFLSILFLECICDKDRVNISNTIHETLESFRESIQNSNYSNIVKKLCRISKSESFIIFQTYNGDPVDKNTNYNDIVIIDKANKDSSDSEGFEITRSELLDFYRNQDNQDIPQSNEILNIKNSLKIVNVFKQQKDLIVGNYIRTPCKISYLQLQFNTDKKTVQNVYMALIFNNKQKYFEILSYTKNILAFRDDIVQRFKTDFKENKPAQYADTKFRQEWLADKKAGDHMCDYNIDNICLQFFKEAQSMLKFFENENSKDILCDKDSMILISNTHIARYFRRLVSERFYNVSTRTTDININKNNLKGIIDFSDGSNLFDIDVDLKNEKYDIIVSEGNSKTLNSFDSCNRKTYKIKYLQCFLIDVMNSMYVHTNKNEWPTNYKPEIKVEKSLGAFNIFYLTFNNIVELCDEYLCNIDEIILSKNYELKQKIEFEKNASGNTAQGISLGSLAKFINDFDKSEREVNIQAYYEEKEISDKNYLQFSLKLPILTKKEG